MFYIPTGAKRVASRAFGVILDDPVSRPVILWEHLFGVKNSPP
jgi:hypothetical protein